MAKGEVSAARTMISDTPRFNVFVASFAPFFNCSHISIAVAAYGSEVWI